MKWDDLTVANTRSLPSRIGDVMEEKIVRRRRLLLTITLISRAIAGGRTFGNRGPAPAPSANRTASRPFVLDYLPSTSSYDDYRDRLEPPSFSSTDRYPSLFDYQPSTSRSDDYWDRLEPSPTRYRAPSRYITISNDYPSECSGRVGYRPGAGWICVEDIPFGDDSTHLRDEYSYDSRPIDSLDELLLLDQVKWRDSYPGCRGYRGRDNDRSALSIGSWPDPSCSPLGLFSSSCRDYDFADEESSTWFDSDNNSSATFSLPNQVDALPYHRSWPPEDEYFGAPREHREDECVPSWYPGCSNP